MILALARFFRGIHTAIGISAVPAEAPLEKQKIFVFVWLGFIVFFIGWCAVVAYWFGS